MAMVIFIFHRLRSLFLMIIGVWRRALCCFRRKRRPSRDGYQLEGVDVITCGQNGVQNSSESGDFGSDEKNWSNWDEFGGQSTSNNAKPNTVQEHIESYRQQAVAARLKEQHEEPAPDFFQDMTPHITEQTKIFIRKQEEKAALSASNRLALAAQSMDSITDSRLGDLGEWEDRSGWEEEALSEWDIDTALKEKRRLEREKQQQRRAHRMPIALSIGSTK